MRCLKVCDLSYKVKKYVTHLKNVIFQCNLRIACSRAAGDRFAGFENPSAESALGILICARNGTLSVALVLDNAENVLLETA
jgi:hypothetical protein